MTLFPSTWAPSPGRPSRQAKAFGPLKPWNMVLIFMETVSLFSVMGK